MTKVNKSKKQTKEPKGKKVELPEAPHRLQRVVYIPHKAFYDKDYHPQSFIQFCREGRTRAYICAAWGISDKTLSRWFTDYPEMADARDVGFQAFKAYFEELAFESLTFPKLYSAAMLQFYLKNKCGWSDDGGRNDHEDVDTGVELNIEAV